jgi:hypothetical protein
MGLFEQAYGKTPYGQPAVTHCLPRLRKVVADEQGGSTQAVNWQGSGDFQMLQLGAPLFGEDGDIQPEVRFADLASFIWLRETGAALATLPLGTPLLGGTKALPTTGCSTACWVTSARQAATC